MAENTVEMRKDSAKSGNVGITVGWAAGRASSLQKTEWWDAGMVICLG